MSVPGNSSFYGENGNSTWSFTWSTQGGNGTNGSPGEVEDTPPWWKLCVMYTVALMILAVNIPVFIIVPKRVPSLQRSMRYTMLSLAVTDFLLGFECILRLLHFVASGSYTVENGHGLCRFDGFMNNLLASVSILSLTWLSVDKLLIVKYPMRHKDFITKKRIILILASIWGAMFILYVPSMIDKIGTANFDPDAYICIGAAGSMVHAFIIVTVVQIIPSVTILSCFITIFVIVKRSQIFRRTASATKYRRGSTTYENLRENVRMIKTLVIMSSGYYIMWVPFFVTVAYWEIINGYSLHPLSDFISCWLGAANSMINPLIYIPTLKPYRRALYALLGIKKKPCTTSQSHSAESVIVQYSKVEAKDQFSCNIQK